MYNQTQDQIAKQYAGQAASLQIQTFGPISCGTEPATIPMSASANDIVTGLMELNGRLRSLRSQIIGPEPEANGCAKPGGPNSLSEALVLAGIELREAHGHVERILGRL